MQSMAGANDVVVDAVASSFAGFFREEYRNVLRAMYLITGDRHQAERRPGRLREGLRALGADPDHGEPERLVYRIALNAHRSALRRRRSARHALSLQPRDPISATDDRDRIRRAWPPCPDGQREAVVLVEWLGMTDAEAGDVLGVSAGAVRVRISRARASLRLEPETPEP